MFIYHQALIKAFNNLNYTQKSTGLCQGITIRWIESCLLEEENIFDSYLQNTVKRHHNIEKEIAAVKRKKRGESD